MLDLKTIKDYHDKAYIHNQITREKASDDLVFYWITQWDENILSDTQLLYRGEFNVLRKAGRQILADLMANPVQVDFQPLDGTKEENRDILNGLYRTDDTKNYSMEAYEVASQEAVVCGFGAWEVYTAYESTRSGDEKQIIKRKPIHEANNTVFFDPQSKLMDRSDAQYVSVLHSYTKEGFESLYKELTGEEIEPGYISQFKAPEHSYTFPWLGGAANKIYIADFYHKEKVDDKLLTMVDPFGNTLTIKNSSLTEVMDEMLDAGYSIESSKDISRIKVTKYIVSGIKILYAQELPGENIPVIPLYGEHAVIEGEDHWEGITRLAKDPSRLRNFAFSYLADILSRSPRQKPIFLQEQIAGYEQMYSDTGAENNYPYLLQNRKAGDGSDLPIGPVSVMPEQPMPTPLPFVIELTKNAVEDVANPGVQQDIIDPETSGKAVLAVQARLDMQSLIYQEHLKHAKRYDAVVYAGTAVEILDVPRTVMLTQADGTKKKMKLLDTVIDKETGDVVTLNDLTNAEFEVFSTIGPSYNSQKEQTVDRLLMLMQSVAPDNPIHQALLLKLLRTMDGVDFDDIRDYANRQLVALGIRKPETPEEMQALEEQQRKAQEETPEMVLAKAETLKGQADIMKEKREGIKMQLNNSIEKDAQYIDVFKATTDRMKVQIAAKQAGATISKTDLESVGQQLENHAKLLEMINPSTASTTDDKKKPTRTRLPMMPLPVSDFSGASNEELFGMLEAG